MNDEFSERGQGALARENKGWDGSSKGVESGRKGGKLPRNAIEKWLNDGKINRENLPRRFEMKVAKKNRGGKKLKKRAGKTAKLNCTLTSTTTTKTTDTKR